MREPQDDVRLPRCRARDIAAVLPAGAARPVGQSRSVGPSPGRERWAALSEVELLLTLAETGDLIDAYLVLQDHGVDAADDVIEACADLASLEDELVRRGFSPLIWA